MSRRHAELLGNLDAAAARTPRPIGGAANQGLESVVTRLTVIFIERHGWNDSSYFDALVIVTAAANAARLLFRRDDRP